MAEVGSLIFCATVPKMPGLSTTERAGCSKILNLMSKGDLLSLSDTVTNKMIVVENSTGMLCFRSVVDSNEQVRIPLNKLVKFCKTVGLQRVTNFPSHEVIYNYLPVSSAYVTSASRKVCSDNQVIKLSFTLCSSVI